MWHLLDANSIWIREFAAALHRQAPTVAWTPALRWAGCLETWQREIALPDPAVRLTEFPLQRGYHRFPVSWLAGTAAQLTARLLRSTGQPSVAPLICTTPYYAPVAERWPGPVVYYQTDLTIEYAGVDRAQVRALDRRLCQRAEAVCPNSRRIAEYMIETAGCPPAKIQVVPNATREANLLHGPSAGPAELPAELAGLPRPVLGVIGNLAANMDWEFLRGSVERTPQFSWVFVGPVTMAVPDPVQRSARADLLTWGRRVRFVGAKPYGLLREYARAFDAAVLPYRRQEPTFSGSSTRFYEHLAAGRPMLATRGFAELLQQEPLLRLVDTPEQCAKEAVRLADCKFADGHAWERWQASREGTWEKRATAVREALFSRWPVGEQKARAAGAAR